MSGNKTDTDSNNTRRLNSNRRTFLATTGTVFSGIALTGTASAASGSVSGVPCWKSSDSGGASSTEIGTGPDEWDSWDGCTPIAASMIIGYHEGISSDYASEREEIIDRLHINMETNNEGKSDPINFDAVTSPFSDEVLQPIVKGIEDYSAGSNSYSAEQVWNVDAEFVLEEIDTNDRPFMLNMLNGGRAEDYPSSEDEYGNHSVTVVGYNWDSTSAQVDELIVHDTWGYGETHVLEWGDWSEYTIIRIEKESDDGDSGSGGGDWWPFW